MGKISTYPVDSLLSSSDLLIGTDADNANATKNYSLGSIAAFIQSLAPANTLQSVLDAGNTATQDVILTGDITILGSGSIITSPNAIIGEIELTGKFRDGIGSTGGYGESITSTGTSTQWKPINLAAVLGQGNSASQDMTIVGQITTDQLWVQASFFDSTGVVGINGQLLGSFGGLTTVWTTVDLDYVLQQGGSSTNNISLTGSASVSAPTVEATQALIVGGTLEDSASSYGTNGQLLMSIVTGTEWTTIGLQEVLDENSSATSNMTLVGQLTTSQLWVTSDFYDATGVAGTNGQLLKSTGGSVLWEDAEAVFTSYRGSFYSLVDQTLVAANTAKAIVLENTDVAATNGVSITSDGANLTRITFANAGVYNVMFSAQVANSAGTAQTVDFWLRKNGLILADNVPNTNGKVQLQGGANHLIAAWNYFIDVDAGDFIHLMFAATSTNISLVHEAASGPHSVTPSVIVTVNKV